jgi:hypothetical protein
MAGGGLDLEFEVALEAASRIGRRGLAEIGIARAAVRTDDADAHRAIKKAKSGARRDDGGENREVVADAPSENEHVPDGVAVGDAFGGEKDDATGIGQSACEQPDQRGERNVRYHRLGGDDHEPAHGDIHGGGQDCKTFHKPEFEQDAGDGESPDNAEERPAPRSAQTHQEERRVGSGNQEVDCGVVEDAQGALDSRGNDRVIERGGGVQADESAAIDGAGHDVPGGATQRGQDEKYHEASDAEQQPDAVGDGVGDFFDGMAQLRHESGSNNHCFVPWWPAQEISWQFQEERTNLTTEKHRGNKQF